MSKKSISFIRRMSACITLGLSSAAAFAQNTQFKSNALQEMTDTIGGYGKQVVNLAFVLSGLIVAFQLVMGLIKARQAGGDAKDAFANVGIGAVVVFIGLGVVSAIFSFT